MGKVECHRKLTYSKHKRGKIMEAQMTMVDIEQKTINQLKALIMDTVRGANSGHTG